MNFLREGILGNVEIIVHLQAKPEGRGIANDLVDSARRDAKVSTKLILTDVHRFDEFLKQNLAWMYRWYFSRYITSITG